MKKHPVVFISVIDYDNLGVGYMASVLSGAGFEPIVINLRWKKSYILKILKSADPVLIGFSVIFDNYIESFTELINYLRQRGINCHFTAGGHFASLKPAELFDIIPSLDSIVRFEGEYTLLELVKSIHSGCDWKSIPGVTYNVNGKIYNNPLRVVEPDLDKFPFPYRSRLKEYAFKKKFTAILAGRGCRYNCSFCNTREFYKQASAPAKRIRRPEMVVKEMEYLYHNHGCSVFIFHDDDFPLKTKEESDWVIKFCNELERTGLNRKIMWKINCRPDEVDEDTFTLMKRNGLYLVFLGIEDGSDIGLKNLNKQLTVKETLKSIDLLKKLQIGFDFGFMIFQPGTTYQALNENLDFLISICSDGYTPATFLRLVPLYGTRIERELLKSGRLKVSGGIEGYDFTEKSLDHYYDFIMDCFSDWMGDKNGVENVARWARNYFSVYMHYFEINAEVKKYHNKIRRTISNSNLFLLNTMKELAMPFESKLYTADKALLEKRKEKIRSKQEFYSNEIIYTMSKFLTLAESR